MTPTTLAFQQQSTSGPSGLASATAAQVFPAQGTTETGAVTNIGNNRNLCNYLTDLFVGNSTAGQIGNISILDGSTVLLTVFFAANSQAPQGLIRFTTPLKGSPNTAMNIKSSNASATVIWSAQGFVAAANL